MTRFPSSQLFPAAVVLGLSILAGCDKKGTTGGPGVSTTSTSTTNGNAVTTTTVSNSSATFNLTVPSTSTSIKQGDSKTISMGLKAGKDFDQTVSLAFDGVPTGVKIDPPAPILKSGDKDVSLVLTAAPDAAPGDYTVKVTGHPATGEDSTADLKISVEKK
jgi:uncharacterized membrane protein